MKRKFTLLIAALALLTMIVQPGRAWGQAPVNTVLWGETWARFSANDVPSGEQSGDGLTIYGSATVEYSVTNGGGTTKIYNEKLAGGTAPELLLAKSNATWTITGIPTGQATEMSLVFLSNKTTLSLTSTTEGITISGSGTNWTITATSSVLSFNLTLTNTGSANARIDDFVLTVTTAGGGGGSDPEIHFNGQSANIGTSNPVGTEVSTSFMVYQSNLTEDITFDIVGYGSLNPSSVEQGADATEVTWSYTPTAAGEFNTTITATSGTASATYNIYGEAKAIHTVNIATMTNGSVTANPTSGIQGTNIDLTITPADGYALETLSVVDGDNNELTVTNNRFQMPDSDVTVSATFEESSAVTVVDYLDREFTGVEDGATTYSSWTGKTGASGAVYAGNSAGSNNSIQLRTNGSASGIVATASAGKVTKVEVEWNTNTSAGRKINVYGSNNAYTDASKLHNATTAGTLIGTIDFGSTTELSITDEYAYIGIRSTSGALYLNWVKISWSSEQAPSPSFTITNNNELAYDATQGSFNFTVNNPATDGVTTVSEEVEWISDVAISDNSVTFNTTANTGAQRSGIITLTYTYNTTETVTKEVTITQAAAPVVYSTIPELFAAATTTETSVEVTFNDWVVSGVSTNGKNVFVTDNNGNGFVIFDNDGGLGNTYTAGDILTGTAVSCSLKKYNGFAELLNVDATDLTITAGGTVTAANVAMADLTGVNTGALLHYDNLTCSVDNNKYYLSDGTTTIQVYNALYAFDALENGKIYNITGVYQQYNSTKEILPRSADDIEEVTVIVPTIIVLDDNVDIPAEGGNGALTVSYENITDIDAEVYFCDAQGAAATYSWISADIDTDNNVEYTINPNDGEARTAYFKVHQKNSEVYSNLVTVSQDEYVVPTYAALPFEFTGGKADIENTDGLYQEGLGSDYSGNNPKLKFDSTDDWLLLQFNEKPGTLTFDIKGNSFSDGTFTVQTSENGETFTDLKNYTNANFGNILYHEEFTNLGENVRYIKWIYTEKANGNVALGNINLAEYVEPVLIPSITVDPAAVSADAEEHDGTLDLTYENLTITSMDDFDIQYYDAQGEETTEPDWVEVSIAEQDPTIGEGYVVSYYMIENEGDARTAYFKVYAMGDNTELVYSNLVTINQAAPETPVVTDNYELYSGALVEGDYLIVYEDYAMNNVVDSDRLQYAEVEITEGVISTDNAAIVWHIAQSGEYWTIYSADANSYAAGTGVKNKAQMLEDGTDDMAMWTVSVSGTETYNFVNKANTEAGVNAYLRNNGTYGFACYAAGTGGPLSLYKKQDNTPSINLSSYSIEAPATVTIEVLTITPANIENFDINYLNADYCNPDGSAIEGTKPDFVEFDFSEDEGYKLTCTISDNDGDARTAYFKVIYELGENDYVYSNVVTVNQAAYVAPVATITVNPYLVEVTKDETDGTLSITLENIEITEAGDGEFSVYFCDAYGEILPDQSSKPDWIGFDFLYENDTWSLYYLIGENETFEPRTAYIKVYGLGDDATTDAYSNLITFTQATAAQTYTLVTSVDDIVPGKHYIIAGIYNNEYYAMAGQATNNRSQVKVTASNEGNTITEVDGLYEFVFSGDNTNNWTIYDETNKGYLYAAGTGSSNQLKYQAENNDRGIWTISINDNNEANVTSITTLTERKIMRYNSGSNCFSCYGSGQNPIYIYMKDNDTSDPVYYSPSIVTVTENIDAHETPVVVLENEILTLTGSLTSSSPDDIVINDGGQLVFNGDDVQATVKKQTIGGTKADHWYTIASPVANNKFGEVTNLTSATYDLYRYNETTSTWENYKETAPEPHAGFYYGYENSAFEAGRGYLYYNAAGSELSFAGILNNDGVTYDLTAGTTSLAGINLMGNPFTQAITLDDITLSDGAQMSEGCYVLTNADGWGASIESINPCEGFLVRVDKNTTATISKPTSGSKSRANRDYIAFTVANSQYEDVTYAMFSKGLGLDKINHRNADIPMVYIPQDGKNYAIATMSDNTEMFNLNFKAMTTGKYTLSYKAQGTYSYLHVIDRFTGEDIDMLVEGEYSFIGSSYDNDARFIVKLSYNANIGEFDTNSIFAYQNGDEIIVNGEGQLQVYDVMGRFVQCINVNGTESISASQFSDAVYIFRMIGETVKTQKIVVR